MSKKRKEWFIFDAEKNEVTYSDYCYFCDSRENLENHHIIKSNDGGTNESYNLLLLCRKCHRKVHKEFILEFKSEGYFIMINREDRLDKRLPNMRQLKFKRKFPLESFKIACEKGGVLIET